MRFISFLIYFFIIFLLFFFFSFYFKNKKRKTLSFLTALSILSYFYYSPPGFSFSPYPAFFAAPPPITTSTNILFNNSLSTFFCLSVCLSICLSFIFIEPCFFQFYHRARNGYRHRIWTRRYEFNSWTWLIAFHIALIPLGKVWIQLLSLQLWVNSRVD